MIAIKMRFLAGRFHATPWGHHVNEGVVEYPPSLWRFLRSLVATFHRTAPENVDEASLQRILDALADAPEFHLPNACVAHTRHYDQANGGVKFFDTFVSLNPKDEVLWIWQNAELDEIDRANLKKVLRNLGTFGRSESWCEAELIENHSSKINSSPVSGGDSFSGKDNFRLLLPDEKGEKLYESLLTETSKMRGKDKQLEPNGSRWVTYSRPSNLLTPRRITPKRKPESKQITVARFALAGNVLPLITKSLPFAELVRRCLIRNRGFLTEHSEVITGKTADGKPLLGHSHAHYLMTDEDGDGRIDHLTIYAPHEFDPNDVAALGKMSFINWQTSRADDRSIFNDKELCVEKRSGRTGVRLILLGLGEASDFAAKDRKVSLFQKPVKSCKFRSITPFSLPNFPTRGGGKAARPKDSAKGQLLRELCKRGLPEPIRVTPTKGYFETLAPIENVGEKTPRFRWLEFSYRRFNGTAGNGLAGFEIEFAPEDLDKINSPLTLGFGCHFGLGLFLPVG